MRYFSMPNRRIVVSALALGVLTPVERGLAQSEATNCAATAESSTSVISAARIARFSPRARGDLIDAIVRNWHVAEEAAISSPIRVLHFVTQIATETGGFTRIEENLDYSAARLRTVFPRRVNPEEAERLAHHPREIANHVYGGRLGNSKSDDGWRYRGSGFLQLTGRGNFRDRGIFLNMPLEDNPDLARTPTPGFAAAVAYWKKRQINSAADKDDIVSVRLRVNGGTTGLSAARIWLARARRIFVPGKAEPTEEFAPDAEEISAVQLRLQEANRFEPEAKISLNEEIASDPKEFANALEQFQLEKGLPATGTYDEDTLYAATDLGSQDPDAPEAQ